MAARNKKCSFLACAKRGLYWLAFPIIWSINLNPIEKFTAVLCVLAGIHFWAFVKSERASVVPNEPKFAGDLVLRLKYQPVTFELKNGGKSTATIEELSARITHGPLPDNPKELKRDRYAFSPVLPNGSARRTLRFETEWSAEVIERVKAGTLPLYLFGSVKYVDEFGKWFRFFGTKETGFCFVYVVGTGISEPGFETCPQYAYTYTK